MNFLKKFIYGVDGKISWSKITIWLAGVSTTIAELNQQLTAAGIDIPDPVLPYIKTISIVCAVIAGIRIRNSASAVTSPLIASKKKK